MQPIIKWTGSKRIVAPELLAHMPANFENYYEPFVGGGSMSYFQSNSRRVFCSDIIPPLIGMWLAIRDRPEELLAAYTSHWTKFKAQGKDYYFNLRAEFNKTKNPLDFFFITRLAVGGLIRFNRNGEFNSGLGYGRNGIQPHNLKKILFDWHEKIKGYEYHVAPYLEIIPLPNSFVFCDPPYTGDNEMYFAGEFNYHLFHSWLANLSRRDIKWMVTTRDVLPQDLYETRFSTSGGNSTFKQLTRGEKTVSEYVYTNYKV